MQKSAGWRVFEKICLTFLGLNINAAIFIDNVESWFLSYILKLKHERRLKNESKRPFLFYILKLKPITFYSKKLINIVFVYQRP